VIRSRAVGRAGALAVWSAACLAACGGGTHTSSKPLASTTSAAVRSGPPARPAPPRGGVTELAGDLTRELGKVGSGYVYDLTTGKPVFALDEGTGRVPASVEKIYTTIALLDALGSDTRLHTTVFGAGHLDAAGVWRGDLYLRGGGDPTFGAPSLSDLVHQLQARGIHRLTGDVIGDGSIFSSALGGPTTGYAADMIDLGGELSGLTYNHGFPGRVGPAAYAADQLRRALRAAHIQTGPTARTGGTPHGAAILASVASPPLSTLVRLMNVPSDDFYAETLTERLGRSDGAAGSFASGTAAISHDLATAYNIHPTVVDGSGLSRANRSSPIEVVDLLRAIWQTPVGQVLAMSLPSVGVEGTVRHIAAHTPARGRCAAKTGTLTGVTNLAGYCHAAGGQMLAFALFIDGPTNERGVAMLSQMVTDMVRLDPSRP
jgi:D-alanyl-D-alanine carboxypeptidase/D-alanyl-D-alanine-endopeptidase (penicillin-binding protein 4)